MDRLFRIDFYPHEWLTDTGRLTPPECGVYIQIVSLIYARRGAIDNDPAEIACKLKDCSSRMARSLIDSLLKKGFIDISAGKISQKRAESELNSKRTHLEHSSKGGRTKAENRGQFNNNNSLSPTERDISLPTPTATATLSPIARESVVVSARRHVEVGKQIAALTGWDKSPSWFGDYTRVEAWLAQGWDPEADILPTVRRLMQGRSDPPQSMRYFEGAIANAHAARMSPLPKGKVNGTAERKLTKSERARIALDEGMRRIDSRPARAPEKGHDPG